MRYLTLGLMVIISGFFVVSCSESIVDNKTVFQAGALMVRIAEIEIDSNYVEEYIAILKEEAEASIRLEPGVICIFPMLQKEKPTEIRLLEIYANKGVYEAHLQTPHFKHYKQTTLNMVKSLELIDMEAIDKETMPTVFRKLIQ